MVLIREDALADIITRSLAGEKLEQGALDQTLRTCHDKCDKLCYWCPGINFDYTSDLVLLLLERAYRQLKTPASPRAYAQRIATALQHFADEFPHTKNTMCYPHFLMHGLSLPTADDIGKKIEDNGRILHETIAFRTDHKREPKQDLPHELYLGNAGGDTDDYHSTCYYLARQGVNAGASYHYIAKFSVFRDTTNKIIVGLTVQGQPASLIRNKDGTAPKNRERGRAYAKLTAQLGMDPRTYTITRVMDIAREQGFENIRVIRANEHPFAIEKHNGFLARYDNAVRAAGITQEKECYLETKLR